MNEDVPDSLLDRQRFCIFRGRKLRAGKGMFVVCSILYFLSDDYLIRVLRQKVTIKQLLRWRKIGFSGHQSLGKFHEGCFS